MKHQWIICLFFLSLGFAAMGQKEEMKEKAKEKIEALRKAYITDKLDLTDSESEQFWPIYDAYKKEEKAFLKANKPKRKKFSELTDEEAEALIEKKLMIEQKILDLKKEYFDKMKTAIPARKIIRLERAEKGFRMEVMRRMKDRKEKMRERGRGNGMRQDRGND